MSIWHTISTTFRRCRHFCGLALLAGALVLVSLPASDAAPAKDDKKKSDLVKTATLTVEQYQVAFIGSGNLGGGKLTFNGKTYSFTIGGLGIGGFGVSRIKASGTVYNLKNLKDFPGAYVQGRYGFAAGDQSAGKLWLQNDKDVVIEIKGDREGLALSLGGDAVYIDFD
ncbi:MAG: hypothetical protein AB7M05_05485 [Alphaproteobacteria bacterium]